MNRASASLERLSATVTGMIDPQHDHHHHLCLTRNRTPTRHHSPSLSITLHHSQHATAAVNFTSGAAPKLASTAALLPWADSSFPFIQRSTTVIRFMVRVPVLSEARRVMVPRVSTWQQKTTTETMLMRTAAASAKVPTPTAAAAAATIKQTAASTRATGTTAEREPPPALSMQERKRQGQDQEEQQHPRISAATT